ncbi:hypothetical protein EDD11_001020 [Mortierella claussenii]|nr:hypothetical protein EDD11_001020 [Mortierella claussenii]
MAAAFAQHPEALAAFHSLYPVDPATGTITTSGPSIYIVRQPAPAKNRSSFIYAANTERRQHIVSVSIKINECIQLPVIPPRLSDDTLRILQSAQGLMSDAAESPAVECWLNNRVDDLAPFVLDPTSTPEPQEERSRTMSAFVERAFSSFSGDDEGEDHYTDSSEDDNAAADADRATKKSRTAKHHLPAWFRPLVVNGDIQYEIWVVGFRLVDTFQDQGTSTGAGADDGDQWTMAEKLDCLLDTPQMRDLVLSEVTQGRIGIDFQRIMEEKKESRKAGRRIVR